MTLDEFPYFENRDINRKLSREAILVIANHLISLGHGEWEDENHSRMRIMWRTPEALASDIYSWVCCYIFGYSDCVILLGVAGTYRFAAITTLELYLQYTN